MNVSEMVSIAVGDSLGVLLSTSLCTAASWIVSIAVGDSLGVLPSAAQTASPDIWPVSIAVGDSLGGAAEPGVKGWHHYE